MSNWYFWDFGNCPRCKWPHHFRVDVPAKKKRLWRRVATPARSFVRCANCGKSTRLSEET